MILKNDYGQSEIEDPLKESVLNLPIELESVLHLKQIFQSLEIVVNLLLGVLWTEIDLLLV